MSTVRVPTIAWVVVCLLTTLSPSCVATMPTPEPVTISFAFSAPYEEHFQALVAAFNEQAPHITVRLVPLRNQGRFDRLTSGDDVVDTFYLPSAFLPALYEQGALLDLRSHIEQDDTLDWEDYYPSVVDLVSIEGTVSALPGAVEPGVVLYNRELFDRYGVPYPRQGWTWQDFVDMAGALRDADAQVFGFAPQILDDMYLQFAPQFFDPLYFVYQNGGRIFDNWDRPTRTTFDDPLTVEAVAWYAKLIHIHGVAPTREEARAAFVGDPRAVYGYMLGKVGMMYGGASVRFPRTGQDTAVDQGVVPPPRGAQSATFCTSTLYAISSRSADRHASWEWLSFLSRQMPPESTPARRSLAASEAYAQAVGEEIAAATRAALESDVVLAFYVEERRMDAIGAFNEAVLSVCEGEMAAQQALGLAQEASRFQ